MKSSFIPNGYFRRLLEDNRGQTLIEYGLLLVLVAVVIIMAITFVGQKTNNVYCHIGNHMPQ